MSTTTKDGYRRTETGYLEPTQDLIRKNRQKPSKEDYFFRNISGENEKSIAEYCLKDGKALLMKGPPGCGKTAFAMWFAKEKGLGFYRVPCNEDTTTRDFFGSLAPDSTGEFIVSPGPVLKGIMDGQAVIIIAY